MNWIILFDDTGECGNRLVSYSFLLSYAREHGVDFTNLCFWRYSRYFNYNQPLIEKPYCDRATNSNPNRLTNLDQKFGKFLRNLLIASRLGTIQRRFIFQEDYICNLSELRFRSLGAIANRFIQSNSGLLMQNNRYSIRKEKHWDHWSSILTPAELIPQNLFQQPLVEKHADYLRKRFQPNHQYQSQVTSFLSTLRKDFDVLVGLHIRRGDYSRYRNGQWYFTNAQYHRWMQQVVAQFPHQKLCFVLASNEDIDLTQFQPLRVYKAPGHFITDMYSLAGCDLIMGSPSTFSGWASFMGKVPIYFLQDATQAVQLEKADVWSPRFY
jgi:Glycosyl transferase family 11